MQHSAHRRNPRVVWRVLPGMVLAQMLDAEPGGGASELSGVAAQVWVVLDEPMDETDIADALELAEVPQGLQFVGEALAQLREAGLVFRC